MYAFSSSGPCMTLLLSKAADSPDVGDGTIDYFRDLIGPKDVNIAKEEAPTRLSVQRICSAKSMCHSAYMHRFQSFQSAVHTLIKLYMELTLWCLLITLFKLNYMTCVSRNLY